MTQKHSGAAAEYVGDRREANLSRGFLWPEPHFIGRAVNPLWRRVTWALPVLALSRLRFEVKLALPGLHFLSIKGETELDKVS